MVQIFQYKALVAALAVVVEISAAASRGLASDQGKSLSGCWERADPSTKYPTSLTYCFLDKGKLQGWDIDNGHGIDFYGRWKKHAFSQVQILLKREKNITCNFEISEDQKILHLNGCTVPSVNGEFTKSNVNIR